MLYLLSLEMPDEQSCARTISFLSSRTRRGRKLSGL
jgi:hypothetical protein